MLIDQFIIQIINFYRNRHAILDIDIFKRNGQHIAFNIENINVQNGMPVSVEINDLYDKLINQHRGGFCYETIYHTNH
jgi:arylamine N-acetyltransferase